MSEYRENNDQRFGRLTLNPIDSDLEAEDLANVCRRLGISGPLEPLLRELKVKECAAKSTVQNESPRKASQKKEKRHSSRTRETADCLAADHFDSGSNQKGSKTSYGQESWGRDSGARDLSPEPNRTLQDLMADAHYLDNESAGGGTSAMIHLASKVSALIGCNLSIDQNGSTFTVCCSHDVAIHRRRIAFLLGFIDHFVSSYSLSRSMILSRMDNLVFLPKRTDNERVAKNSSLHSMWGEKNTSAQKESEFC